MSAGTVLRHGLALNVLAHLISQRCLSHSSEHFLTQLQPRKRKGGVCRFSASQIFVTLKDANSLNSTHILQLDIVWTVYHLVIYMQSNNIHNVVSMSKF